MFVYFPQQQEHRQAFIPLDSNFIYNSSKNDHFKACVY